MMKLRKVKGLPYRTGIPIRNYGSHCCSSIFSTHLILNLIIE